MNKPASELIALADALDAWGSLVSSGYEVPGAGQVMTESAHALRTVATMREALEKIVEGAPKVEPESYCDDFGYFSDDYSDLYFRGVETQHWRLAQIAQDALATPPAQPAPAGGLHPSHVTRSSDASTYDEVCVNCGATDITGGGWGKLAEPCPSESTHGKPDGAVCCSAISPCEYQRTHRTGVCETCQKAAALSPKIAAAETSPGDVLAMKEALDVLQLQQRGRARAFRLLDNARDFSDPVTLAKADAYEECGNELKAALPPKSRHGDIVECPACRNWMVERVCEYCNGSGEITEQQFRDFGSEP